MLLDMMGLALTLLALALLAAGGYLAALRLLGEEAGRDPLALAIASLLAAIAEAVAIGLLLGVLGVLRIELALAAQTLLVAVLERRRRPHVQGGHAAALPGGLSLQVAGRPASVAEAELWGPARQLARRTWERLRSYPGLSLLTVHAVGSEALRGLLRPPLSWDSLMYHLLLTATWLQEHNLAPVFGSYPVNDYGYVPANGSIWLWWWMAPSHSELYANLTSLPHWVLLGLAAGGVARQLGARRHWPLASYLVLLTPTVVRFAATQYVDILVGATLLAGFFFIVRWMERPRLADAVLAGAGCGLACGAKILGVPYAAALAAAAVILVPWRNARWRVRVPQLAVSLLVSAALGSFFYVRNMALGAGPLALACEGRLAEDTRAPRPPAGPAAAGRTATLAPPPRAPAGAPRATPPAAPAPAAARPPVLPTLPRRGSVVDLWPSSGRKLLLDAFLGITRPHSLELGLGPQVLVLLLAFLALPFGVARDRRRVALLAASQIAAELLFWLAVPYADNLNLFANIRYLIPAAGLAFAGGVAIAERWGVSDLWLRGIALALACQSLLQLHAEMPRGVRLVMAFVDLAAVAFVFSPALRGWARRRAGALAAAVLALALLGAPLLARFRAADRARALASEWVAHASSANLFAGGWGWLDAHGGHGTVDVVGTPGTYFVYPAMGAFLERKAHYVNVNRANYRVAARYPGCNPRVDPSPQAWIDNVAMDHVRWLLSCHYFEYDFPLESHWAAARPDLFALRYADRACLVYEYLPEGQATSPRELPAPAAALVQPPTG
jgi:hypothetical protein